MKINKCFFLIFVSSVLLSCDKTSEEELKGDWQKRNGFLKGGRSFSATFVIDDKGYVIGGKKISRIPLNDVFVFDHTGGSKDMRGNSKGIWSQLKPFPGRARSHAVGFSLKVGGKKYGYVGTGWALDDKGEDLETRNDFWRYDPSDDSWVEIAPLPAEPRKGAFAFSLKVGGKEYGYVGGGYDEPEGEHLKDFWRYDPETNVWTQESSSIEKREGAVAFVLDNKAYICNGKNQTGTASTSDFLVFDPNAEAGERWTNLRYMANTNPNEDYDDDYGSLQRAYGVAYVVEVDNELRGHIVGGEAGNNASQNWEYNHIEDLWVRRTTFVNNNHPVSRAGMISFSFPNTGRAFVGLGFSGTTPYDDIWEFDPLVDDYIYDDGV